MNKFFRLANFSDHDKQLFSYLQYDKLTAY